MPSQDARRIVAPALVVLSLAVAALVLLWLGWSIGRFLLQIFGAVLFAILLDGATRVLTKRTPLPRAAALAVVGVGVLGFLAGASLLVGPRLTTQLKELSSLVPKAEAQLRALLHQVPGGDSILNGDFLNGSGATVAKKVGQAATSVFDAAGNLVLVPVIGLYLAIAPGIYTRGLLLVLPGDRDKAEEVLTTVGHVLRRWLVGRFASMVAVGTLCGVGLSLLGVPLAFALGVLAGLLSFVPFLGPILSVLPAMLVALPNGGLTLAAWVAALYAGVQFVEGMVITPVIEKRAVFLPPALLIAFQVGVGILGGLTGVILATPLLVVLVVLIQMLYVRDVLGREVDVIGTEPDQDSGK